MWQRYIVWHRFALILFLLGVWEAAARFGSLDRDFFSPPSRVALALVEMISPRMLHAVQVTAMVVGYGFALSVVVGVVLGTIVGLSPFLYRTIQPIINLLFATPKMVFLPLFLLFFGIGVISRSVFSFSLGVFPILLNVVAGIRMIEPSLITAARSMGASKSALFLKVLMPAALPSVITGMRLSIAQTVMGVLLAELYSANSGLGFYATLYSQTFKPEYLFALFFIVALLSIVVNELLRSMERWASRWREEEAEEVIM